MCRNTSTSVTFQLGLTKWKLCGEQQSGVCFSVREREKEVPSTPEEASLKIAAELVSIAIFDSCSVTGTPPPHSLSGLFLGGREPPQVKISNISTVYPSL